MSGLQQLVTLNLGVFPRNVLDLEESPLFLDQITLVDFQLQRLVESKSPGNMLFIEKEDSHTFEVLESLIAQLVAANRQTAPQEKSYLEQFYYAVVLSHLHYLKFDIEGSSAVIKEFKPDASAKFATKAQAEFSDYLAARFYCLHGLSTRDGHTTWYTYLRNIRRYGSRSQVAGNKWTDCIFRNVLKSLSGNRSSPLRFETLAKHPIAENTSSLVALCNYACKPENSKYVARDFHSKYASFLADLLHSKAKQKGEFPNATDANTTDMDFTQSLYETLNDISSYRPVVSYFVAPKLSKSFLLSMTEKTYQDQCVLSNLIRTLLDLEEYDEALAAFQTYTEYIEREKEQDGNVNNIVEVIAIYALCLEKFNPLNSSIPDSKSANKKFKYNSIPKVVESLEKFALKLLDYLQECSLTANLTYESNPDTTTDNNLSFLYQKHNTNVIGGSKLLSTVSHAWFALGSLSYFLCVHDSPNSRLMEKNRDQVLLFYKNCLIADCKNNSYLFDYALMLSYNNSVSSAQKICKYVLKRHPENFKMWNLLVLLMSAEESMKSLESSDDSSTILEDENKAAVKLDSERFAEDALNIAGLYILKNKESNTELTVQAKYEILQLKQTQIAVLEQIHGIDYILELIPDVFVLYRELFQSAEASEVATPEKHENTLETKYSHRPTLYDHSNGSVAANGSANGSANGHAPEKKREQAKEKIKSLSRAAGDKKGKGSIKKEKPSEQKTSSQILQKLWLWAASLYLKLGQIDEAEECIVEAESTGAPNVDTYTYLGFLTASSRPQLALQEYERCLELFHSPEEYFNKKSYGATLLGMSELFITEKGAENALFISEKDTAAGLARVKNYLESYSNCWPYGYTSSEVWYYLSTLYEKFDDRILQQKALWQCVAIENYRPVRPYQVCEDLETI